MHLPISGMNRASAYYAVEFGTENGGGEAQGGGKGKKKKEKKTVNPEGW